MWDKLGWLNWFWQFLCKALSSFHLKWLYYSYAWSCSLSERRTGFNNYHKIVIHNHVQKTYIRHETFYIVIFLTIFPNLAKKTNIEVSFKKKHTLNVRIYFKKYTAWRERKPLHFHRWVTFHIIITYIFPENFTEIHQVFFEDTNFYFFNLNYFCHFFGNVLPLFATKRLMTSASIRSKNCNKLY